ncbi:MAG: class I SAM-dependent methyltransferase [Candidatus Binataceae bacterium]
MTRNIYDNEEFFAAYSRLERSVYGLEGAPEWPVLRSMLPKVRGRRILDLGCGFGWFCRWAHEQGAAEVLGIDISAKMLAQAKVLTHDGVSYLRADLETLALPATKLDLVYSSLTFHYVERLDALFGTIHASLVPGGKLVFSVEHPIMTASASADWIDIAGRQIWPVNGYFDEGPRSTDWLVKAVIKRHRTVASYVNALLERGFALSGFEEWSPSEEQVRVRPDWTVERQRPFFLLIAATR